MNHSFLYTIILTLVFFYGIKTFEIQRKVGDLFPGEPVVCSAAGGFVDSQGLCRCTFNKQHFVSVEGKAPLCRGTTEIKNDLKCSLAPLYIGKNGQATSVSQNIYNQFWTCSMEFVEAQYWNYNHETNTGSWKTSAILADLTVKRQQNEVLKIQFDDRNWNGMIIKLIKKRSWCTTCKIIKFEGTLDYPIKQGNFLPKLLTTTLIITTTTADTTNIPSTNTTTPTSTPTTITATTKTSIPTETTQQNNTIQTTNNISETTKDSDILMIGVVVGVAATITLLVIFLAICVIYRRKKKKPQNNQGTTATIPVANPSYETISSEHNPYSAISSYKGRSEIYMGLNQLTVEINSTASNFDSTVTIDETTDKDNIPHYEVNIPHYEVDVPLYEVGVPHYEVEVRHYEVSVLDYEVDVPHYDVDKTDYEVSDIDDYEDCDTSSEINLSHEIDRDDYYIHQ